MPAESLVRTATSAAIVAVIGAFASMLVERIWKRRKAKRSDTTVSEPSTRTDTER